MVDALNNGLNLALLGAALVVVGWCLFFWILFGSGKRMRVLLRAACLALGAAMYVSSEDGFQRAMRCLR